MFYFKSIENSKKGKIPVFILKDISSPRDFRVLEKWFQHM